MAEPRKFGEWQQGPTHGVPEVVTPQEARWQKANNPRYDEFKDIVKERLAKWKEKNAPAPAPEGAATPTSSEEADEDEAEDGDQPSDDSNPVAPAADTAAKEGEK